MFLNIYIYIYIYIIKSAPVEVHIRAGVSGYSNIKVAHMVYNLFMVYYIEYIKCKNFRCDTLLDKSLSEYLFARSLVLYRNLSGQKVVC